jgi:hypothetical protein
MAQETTIKLDADVKDAIKSVKDLTKQVEDLQKAQEEQSKKHLEEIQKINDAQKKQTGILAKVKAGTSAVGLAMKAVPITIVVKMLSALWNKLKENQEVMDTISDVMNAVGIVLGDIATALKSTFDRVSEATGGFDALGKVLGGAFSVALNSLVLVIQGVTWGVKQLELAWKNWFGSAEDADKVRAELEQLESDMAKTTEKIGDSAKQIGENFIEAVSEVGTAASEMTKTLTEEIGKVDAKAALERGKQLTQLKKNYERVALEQSRLIEQYDKEAETQRQLRDDTSLSIDERIKANEELGKVLAKQLEAEENAAKAQIANLKQQMALEGESEDLKNRIYAANTELLAIQAKVTGQESEQLVNTNSLLDEKNALIQTGIDRERERNKVLSDEAIENEQYVFDQIELKRKQLEDENKIIEDDIARKRELYAEGTQARVDAEQDYLDQINNLEVSQRELDQQYADEIVRIEDEKQAAKYATLDAIIGIADQESALGKAALIAKQLMAAQELLVDMGILKSKATMAIADANLKGVKSTTDTASGLNATLALGFPAAIPGLIAYAASAVGIVKGIMTAIKGTKQVAGSLGGQDRGGGSSPAPTTPAPMVPETNLIGGSGTNQIAEALAQNQETPVQAYVVSNNVTTAQSLERNIVDTTSL